MSNVLNRITKKYIKSVNTPDYPATEWIINPVLPDCEPSEWVIEGNVVRETTQDEKDETMADKLAKEAEKIAKELLDKEKADADRIKAREDFLKLTLEEKVLYLYDKRM